MGENKKFEWEGDNLQDFYKKSIDFAIDLTFQKEMKEFDEQQSKTIPLDYEILEFLMANDHNFQVPQEHTNFYLERGFRIYSVKRKSDGEVFCVGDEINNSRGKIKEFTIDNGVLLVHTEGQICDIAWLGKVWLVDREFKTTVHELMQRLHAYFLSPTAAMGNLKQLAQQKINSK